MGYPTGALHRIPANVAEAVVDDVHQYADEKREALELWAQHLAKITNPVPMARHS
jgi:hypothetical protein